MKLKIEQFGNVTGFILPEDLVARLNLQQAESVYAKELPDGGLELTPYDPDSETALRPASGTIDSRREI
jgi:antitoxin component of MazEF toxin-antitoxin module